jgi:hypothetical protein
MKAMIAVIAKSYKLEFPDPAKTELEIHSGGFLNRPKTMGRQAATMELKITRLSE